MNKRRWVALLSAIGIVLAAALTTAFVTRGGGTHEDDSPLVAPPTTVTSTERATTTTLEKLPQPEPAPSDPYAPTPIVQVGVIEIPKIGLIHPVYEGVTLTVIDHGPGHWPGSAMPCQRGNTVFPGHRVTHSHPFLNLDQLAPGDQIIFHEKGKDCVYAVSGTQIVYPTDMWVIDPTRSATVTLIACHPKHSAAQRIVVKGTLVKEIPKPGQT
jgi:sortase A